MTIRRRNEISVKCPIIDVKMRPPYSSNDYEFMKAMSFTLMTYQSIVKKLCP